MGVMALTYKPGVQKTAENDSSPIPLHPQKKGEYEMLSSGTLLWPLCSSNGSGGETTHLGLPGL